MENPFDLIDLENTIHLHHVKWHYENPCEAKATTWSIIAAHADSFCYNYEYLVHFINERNKTCGWGGDPYYYCPIPIPTKLEFLEILEFCESELWRATKDTKAEWCWPQEWGHVPWGGPVINKRVEVDGKYTLFDERELEKKVWLNLQSTQDAIMVHKILMGHLSSINIACFDIQRNISLLFNIFYRNKNFSKFFHEKYSFKLTPTIELPPVLLSYDLPPALQKSKNNIEGHHSIQWDSIQWDIDELLGLYCPNIKRYKSSFSSSFSPPKNGPQILIYPRGIEYCSKETGLNKDSLRQITITHELAHWAVHLLPDINGQVWQNDLFELTHSEVHEGWAQLLTYWTLEYLKDSKSMEVFEELNKNQSPSYHKFKVVLHRSSNQEKILNSLVPLRTTHGGASFSDWLKFL